MEQFFEGTSFAVVYADREWGFTFFNWRARVGKSQKSTESDRPFFFLYGSERSHCFRSESIGR